MADDTTSMALRYVALGDSYTIGTSVPPADRWPDRLAASLTTWTPPVRLDLVANLGVNGYTSADLIRQELPAVAAHAPGFVSVLIGVNDVVQGVPDHVYARNAAAILDALLAIVRARRMVVVSIPDYTVTPSGADYGDPDRQRDGIVRNNATMARLADQRGIALVDVFELSRRAASARTLVAADGLHPSGAQYELWVERIAPIVHELITGE